MAKKKTARRKTPARQTQSTPAEEHSSDEPSTASTNIDSAADAVRAAQQQLRRAQAEYVRLREQAAEKVDEIRDTTVGDMVDGAMDVVSKHPGQSLLAAFALGFIFDRWLRK